MLSLSVYKRAEKSESEENKFLYFLFLLKFSGDKLELFGSLDKIGPVKVSTREFLIIRTGVHEHEFMSRLSHPEPH